MTFTDIQFIFNRALRYSFSAKKNFAVFVILALCGILTVFFRGLAMNAGEWVTLSLLFVPFFLCAGVLLSAGIVLIRLYHDEVKGKTISYSKTLSKSWELIIGASYFSVPIILCYLILWMMLGIFMMLHGMPVLGEAVGVILSFAPFLINLATLILCVMNLAMLFFVAPVVALKGLNRQVVTDVLLRRWKSDPFSNLVLAFIAILPLVFVLSLLIGAAVITGSVCVNCTNPIWTVIEWFFVMIPFTAILAPAVLFFFNFAAESHVLLVKQSRLT